jgi:hypothetical protein
MGDAIYESFLRRQHEEGMRLKNESDILDLAVMPVDPPDRYMARFNCRGLVRDRVGHISEANEFYVGVRFPADYLRRADPLEVLTWLGPRDVFHPNISDRAPIICVGRLAPGTGLVDILYQLFEIITYQKVTMREDDALNRDACGWARLNRDRFPIDDRPLKRRTRELSVTVSEQSQSGEK